MTCRKYNELYYLFTAPLYRLYNSKTFDHFYTTSLGEATNAVQRLGYTNEGKAGLVAKAASNASNCKLTPVYRLHNQKNDHFYTTSNSEASTAASRGYRSEGIAFYCATKSNECDATLPFYRYLIGADHFYTTNAEEGIKSGGIKEGILCYIWN